MVQPGLSISESRMAVIFYSRLDKSCLRLDDVDWINLPQHKRMTQYYRYIIKMPIYDNHQPLA